AIVAAAYEPLPRRALHAIDIDGDRELIAASSWSEIVLARMVDGRSVRLGHTKTEAIGNVEWIGIAGPYIAALIGQAYVRRLEVRRLRADLSIGEIVLRHDERCQSRPVAAMSRDGRYLATAFGDRLLVHDLARR